MKMKEIAKEIDGFLKKFEADPVINTRLGGDGVWYYDARAITFDFGKYVYVTYIAYQGPSKLTKTEAMEYLEWLRAGNVGRHLVQQRNKKT